MANTTRAQEIEALRDNALKTALGDLLKFLDPSNPDCGVDPEVRRQAGSYLDSWVAGPLAAALNRQDLGAWREGCDSVRIAEEFLAKVR